MNLEFAVEQTVRARRSVRTFEHKALSTADKEKVLAYMQALSNPFNKDVIIRITESSTAAGGERLGTYGMINGAKCYIGAIVTDEALALEALGYSFEKLVLYATSLGLGTCWLGGTFNRSKFAQIMGVKENQMLPIVSPIGYPANQKRFMETIVRATAHSDRRKDWSELFFENDFATPLAQSQAGDYGFALEMLRLAPSASNQQPWRVVKKANAFHFYEAKAKRNESMLGFDIQRVDLGIAACHFHLAAQERDLQGKIEYLQETGIQVPENTVYRFSWIAG